MLPFCDCSGAIFQCNIIQEYHQNSLQDNNRYHRKKITKLCVLKDKKREIITIEKDIKERWNEYTEELYKKDEIIKEIFKATTSVQESAITEAKVANAIKEILSGKSPEIDEIPAKLIKAKAEKIFCIVLFIFILHSRESELYRYTLDWTSALAWELPFPRCLDHLSST